MRVLVTGSRTWDDAETIHDALRTVYAVARDTGRLPLIVVHGACSTGADAIADRICLEAQRAGALLLVERHPAPWASRGKAAGFVRNQEMVDAGAHLCLAFIRDGSAGATHCANAARKAGIPMAEHPYVDPEQRLLSAFPGSRSLGSWTP